MREESRVPTTKQALVSKFAKQSEDFAAGDRVELVTLVGGG